MSAPIFISYSSKDRDMAETICRALEARGHQCWISCRDVPPGQNFQEAIVQALRSAQVMLLVFTANANNSDEIKKELVLAGRHRVTVVPIRVEDVAPNDAFAYELATRQWIDLYSDWEKEIERLAVRLGQILQTGKPPDGDGAEAATFAGVRPRIGGARRSGPGVVVAISALVAVLLVIGAAVLYLRPFARAPSAAPPVPQQTAAAPPTPAPAPSPPSQPAASPAKPESPALLPAPVVVPAPPPAPSPPPQVTAPPAPEPPAAPPSQAAPPATPPVATLSADEQLRIADQILASPAKSKAYDGRWSLRISCPALGRAEGYISELSAEVKDGAFHASMGNAGEAGSLIVEGKIGADGAAAFLARGFVGSRGTSGGLPPGTPYFFHALARFERTSGAGTRIELRPCNLTFAKQ